MHSNSCRITFIHSSGSQSSNQGSTPLINYLSAELEPEHGFFCPLMPSPCAPSYEAWKNEINKVDISQSSICIGHSLGASVLLKYLSVEKHLISLDALFLIATPFWGLPEWTHGDYFLPNGFEEALKNIKRIYFYHSADDGVVPFSHLQAYRSFFPNAIIRVLDNYGHYFENGLPILIDDLRKSLSLDFFLSH